VKDEPMTATEVNRLKAECSDNHAAELNEMGLKIVGPKVLRLYEEAIARIMARKTD
jgi:hypothetical protein